MLPWLFSLRRRDRAIERAQRTIDVSAAEFRELQASLKQVLEAHTEEQERNRQRLENLEAIVTSQAWDAVQAGTEAREKGLLLEERAEIEMSDEKKVSTLARRIR